MPLMKHMKHIISTLMAESCACGATVSPLLTSLLCSLGAVACYIELSLALLSLLTTRDAPFLEYYGYGSSKHWRSIRSVGGVSLR